MTSIIPLTPSLILRAYAAGVFPMARTREDDEVLWIDPKRRGVIPLEEFHVPRSLVKTLRHKPFEVRCDTAFAEVIAACAAPRPGHEETWINEPIEELFNELHAMGLAHSVECWRDGELVGGLYGLALGAAFFGESMFSRRTDASKVALCHLVAILKAGGFLLLDTQFITEHLSQFGAREIPRGEYQKRLAEALRFEAEFQGLSEPLTHSSTQTS